MIKPRINPRKRAVTRYLLPLISLAIVVVVARFLPGLPVAPEHAFFNSSRLDVAVHGGGMAEAPQNSWQAFARADQLGVDVFELDVHLSRDGQLVVIHDDTLERTTNGTGYVRDRDLASLQQLDAGYWTTTTEHPHGAYPFRGQGYRLASLAELFARYPQRRFIVELKPDALQPAEVLCRLIGEQAMVERVMVGSFYDAPLQHFRQLCPQVATSASQAEVMQFFVAQKFGLSHLLTAPIQALVVPVQYYGLTVVTPGFVAAAHARGIKVYVRTVNREAQMQRLMGLGVDGLVTDYPDRLLQLLSS